MVGGRYGDVKGLLRALGLLMSCNAALISMRAVYLVRKEDGEIYYGVHECIDCALYNHSNHSREHATNIVPECKRTS